MTGAQFFLISAFDGERWVDDEIAEHNFVPRVRQMLGGRWERKAEYDEFVHAYFNESSPRMKRVLVLGFPPDKGWTREKALAALREIHEGREDMS